MDILLNLG